MATPYVEHIRQKSYVCSAGVCAIYHHVNNLCAGARRRAAHMASLEYSQSLPRTKGHTKQPCLSTAASIIFAQQAAMNSSYVCSPDVASKIGVKVKVQCLIEVAHNKISYITSVLWRKKTSQSGLHQWVNACFGIACRPAANN